MGLVGHVVFSNEEPIPGAAAAGNVDVLNRCKKLYAIILFFFTIYLQFICPYICCILVQLIGDAKSFLQKKKEKIC